MRKILRKHSFKRIMALVLTTFILTACGQQEGKEETIRIQSKADVRLLDYPGASSFDQTLTQGINNFAYNMSAHLAESGENYFFSPYSICVALSVLDNAAQGETKSQME
ncbi:MAG: serpin family protein [Lachnospiraceae bacterium]|nr:serpin family protein [Lachnospiraceae bacterium]